MNNDLIKQISHGWEISALGYSKFIVEEFNDGTANVWKEELRKLINISKSRVLDLGSGPGLFAILLSKLGHDVTAIDGSNKMLHEANINAINHGVKFKSLQMQADHLDFPNSSFDYIVSRNVIWTLANPTRAYSECHRVLKDKGRLIIYDGDYLADLRDPIIAAKKKIAEEEYIREHNMPLTSFDPDKYEAARGWRIKLPLINHSRPEWDIKTLEEIGFNSVITRYLGEEFNPKGGHGGVSQQYAPMFVIYCDK